jgi:starch synthase
VADLGRILGETVLDRATAARFGAAGRERARAVFDWDAIAAQTVEIYRALV